jgi:hypothetical protein
VVRTLGGTARRWRFDRMAIVCYPFSGQVTSSSPWWPSNTGSGSTSAHHAGANARARWRRPTTVPRNAGGVRSPTT